MQERFVRAASVGELSPGDMKVVVVDGKEVALANAGGRFYAFSNACSHLECPLAEGTLDGETVECPCHGSLFNVRSGAVLDGPAQRPIAVYDVQVQGDVILVGALFHK